MSLRRSFWDFEGNPDRDAWKFRAFLEKYYPDEDKRFLHIDTRKIRAMRRYVMKHYPDQTFEEAWESHMQACRFDGDLAMRISMTSDSKKIKTGCEQFRDACRLWQKGERSTDCMLKDARDFVAIVQELDPTKVFLCRGDTANLIKRELELSSQFANAIVNTIEEAALLDVEPEELEILRVTSFSENLEREFSTFQ